VNGTQSCASCHAPEVGFTGLESFVNASGAVYQGALPNHFGNRKPPSAAYAGDSLNLYFDEQDDGWFGGSSGMDELPVRFLATRLPSRDGAHS